MDLKRPFPVAGVDYPPDYYYEPKRFYTGAYAGAYQGMSPGFNHGLTHPGHINMGHGLTHPGHIGQQQQSSQSQLDIPTTLLNIELSLVQKLKPILIPPPVSYIYSPLEYAYEPHADYVRRYCQGHKKILFLGMNPGPWGMSQTGVPFGEVNLVKNWLKVEGRIGKPLIEHPSRIVEGFNCPRSEVSGQRFWSYWKDLCKEPEVLFKYAYIHNYCPLAFMKVIGRHFLELVSGCHDNGKHVAMTEVVRPEEGVAGMQTVDRLPSYRIASAIASSISMATDEHKEESGLIMEIKLLRTPAGT